MAHTQRWTIWVCPDCGATNVHAERCGVAFPGDPVVHGNRVEVVPEPPVVTGERMYTAWRDAMNTAAARRGNTREKHWNDLKPWVKSVWNDAVRRAEGQSGEIDQPKETR